MNDSIWKHPSLLYGAVGIFAYVGAEVSIGSFLVNYFGLPEIAGLSAKTAAGFVSFYWGGAMIGRFVGAGTYYSVLSRHPLALCAVIAAALVTASMPLDRSRRDVDHPRGRVLQLDYVPHHLQPGRGRTRPSDGNGSGILNMAIVGGAIPTRNSRRHC